MARGVKAGTKRGPYGKTGRKIEDFQPELRRALAIALSHRNVLPRGVFHKGTTIRKLWGKAARDQFVYWFSAKKIFDDDRCHAIKTQFVGGTLTESVYRAKLSRCFYWVWYLRDDRIQEAHDLVYPVKHPSI